MENVVGCQITFAGMDGTEPVRTEIHAWLLRLGLQMAQVKNAHVFVEGVDENRKLRAHRVRMDLSMLDGAAVTVAHDHPANGSHEDVFVAVRNAFRAARRELEEWGKKRSSVEPIDTTVGGPAIVLTPS
ncbi:MAG TPA: hypothetical protein VH374_12295 [Polyangia bacterium]|jgi:hypothetical protein|nr:hypothetical protein [Polyangia bacterium]